jgi:hypothetical protein
LSHQYQKKNTSNIQCLFINQVGKKLLLLSTQLGNYFLHRNMTLDSMFVVKSQLNTNRRTYCFFLSFLWRTLFLTLKCTGFFCMQDTKDPEKNMFFCVLLLFANSLTDVNHRHTHIPINTLSIK